MKKVYKYVNPITGGQVSRQRMWQIKKVASGRCAYCGLPATHGRRCFKHYLYWVVYNRERQRKRIGCKSRYLGAKSYRFG